MPVVLPSLRNVEHDVFKRSATLSLQSPVHRPSCPSLKSEASIRGSFIDTSTVYRSDPSKSLAHLTSRRKNYDPGSKRLVSVTVPADETLHVSPSAKELGPLDLSVTMMQTKVEETGIAPKEEALEEIMSAVAFDCFEEMARYQLNKNVMSRSCVDSGIHLDSDFEYEDVDAVVSDTDDELVEVDLQVDPFQCIAGFKVGLSCPQEGSFIAHCGKYTLLGLADGHGQAHVRSLLVKSIVHELPHAVFGSKAFVRGDVEVAVVEAFHRVHKKVRRAHDVRTTGSSLTVLLIGSDTVWIAHVGECRVVKAVPDESSNAEDYHFVPVALTTDHKVSVPSEYDRIISRGGTVRRLVNDTVPRLFLLNSNLPGLTLTRVIGSSLAHTVGVTHTPCVTSFGVHELPEGSFLVLATGALWSNMSERATVNWVGRYYSDADQAARCLSAEALRRSMSSNCRTRLRQEEPESFSTVLLFPSKGKNVNGGSTRRSVPRPFAIGSHQNSPKQEWHEVHSSRRSRSLRHTQGWSQRRDATGTAPCPFEAQPQLLSQRKIPLQLGSGGFR